MLIPWGGETPSSMRIIKVLWPWCAVVLSGVLLALCYAPFDTPVMVWVGLIPLFAAVWGSGGVKRGPRGFALGYLAGLSFWLINLKWISEVGTIGWIAVSCFLALYFALWGLFASGAGNPWRQKPEVLGESETGIAAKVSERLKKEKRRRGRSVEESRRVLIFAIVNACCWCGLEWVRGWFFTGFGWNGLGVAFHNQPILAQGADLVGVSGLSFLPVFVMGVVVQVGRGLYQEIQSGRLRAHWDFGCAMVVLASCFMYGVWKLHGEREEASTPLNVLLVQLNIPQEASQKLWSAEDIYRGYEEETLEALESLSLANEQRVKDAMEAGYPEPVSLDVPDWIVWPESALPDVLYYGKKNEQELGRRSLSLLEEVKSRGQFTLLFGMLEYEAERIMPSAPLTRKERGKAFNSLVALPKGESVFRTYRKQHLVLFGETIPYVEQLGVLRWLWEKSAGTEYGGSFSAGDQQEPMRLPLPSAEGEEFSVIPTVCFEDTVARKMRKFVKGGGQLIVNITNDGWFKNSEAAAQHFANAKFRSIEFRRPTVRSANTGVSAVINSHGTVLNRKTMERRILLNDSDSHLTRGWLYSTVYVPLAGRLTVYARFGDWFAVLALLAAIGWWITRRRNRFGKRG